MKVDIRPTGPCHRCGGELCLIAEVPHPSMPGDRLLPLCPRCDANDSAARKVLEFFASKGRLGVGDQRELRNLAFGWIAAKNAAGSGVDARRFKADLEAWWRGELD